ncbi:MAG TPA: M48 family metallopeptidase [Longimicrobiaceae bacterium]|nr:M48 family metallopeptidase [Longimicrobiaceae bacterium]
MLPRLAESAQRHPRLYRLRVTALATLGYGLVLGVLAVLIALFLLVVVLGLREGSFGAVAKLGVPLLFFIGVLVEAMWIEIAPPKGIVLTRAEAPALWDEIERVRREIGAPAPYQVLVDGELNASVQQVPRFGFLGWYRTYLTIGLPLAASLTAEEFRAVLAHEYGHVSRKHGGLAVWIYRVRATYEAVLQALEERRHWSRGVLLRFLRWYAPFLDAYTAVLRRAHEFEADRAAAQVAGTEAAASTLCRVRVSGRYLESVFWPSVSALVPEREYAPADVFRRLLREGPEAAQHADAALWLTEEAGRRTEPWDSHPSLAERLAALGAAPALPGAPARPSAAEGLFGPRLEGLADRLGRRWADSVQFSWRKEHEEQARAAERLAALEAHAAGEPLAAPQARERILLTVQLHGETVAMPLMRDFLDAGEEDPYVSFLLGGTLLKQGDEAGLRHLERAMELDVDATPTACAIAADFLDRGGRAAEAEGYRRRSDAYVETMQQAAVERDTLSPKDRLLPHGLDEAEARALGARIAATVGGIKRILLVRKEVAVRADSACWVLAVEPVWKRGERDEDAANRLMDRLMRSVSLPGSLIVVDLSGNVRAFRTAIERVPGAELYRLDARPRAAAR